MALVAFPIGDFVYLQIAIPALRPFYQEFIDI
jgi:hypothetical protein